MSDKKEGVVEKGSPVRAAHHLLSQQSPLIAQEASQRSPRITV
jgi:hypothetical protein